MSLTIRPTNREGRVEVEDHKGRFVAWGRARPSNTMPGYITIHLNIEPHVIRVPIDWIQAFNDVMPTPVEDLLDDDDFKVIADEEDNDEDSY